MTRLVVPTNEAVKSEAIKVLIEQLGIGKSAFFIRETMAQPLDYLKLKDQLFGTMTVSEIYAEIQQNQQNHE
jgi:hypothetical protein